MNTLPFRFNPRRHRRLLRLARIRWIILTAFIVCVSFLVATALFSMGNPENWRWVLVGVITSVISGTALKWISRELKEEHR